MLQPQRQLPLILSTAGGFACSNPHGVGTGGTSGLATGWDSFNNAAGTAAWTKVGAGIEAGIPYNDIRYNGTVGAGSPDSHVYPGQHFTAVQGQIVTAVFWIKLIAGAMTNITFSSGAIEEFDAATSYLTGTYPTLTIPSNVPLNHPACLCLTEYTIANAACARGRSMFLNTITASSAVDATFRVGWLTVFAGKLPR